MRRGRRWLWRRGEGDDAEGKVVEEIFEEILEESEEVME